MPSTTSSLDGSFPPSPAEDRGSPRLSWGSLLQRLQELKRPGHGASEPDSDGCDSGSVLDASLSDWDSSVLSYPLEETLAAEVVETIAQRLKVAHHTLGCSRLVPPDCLLHNIGQELLHLAATEPCGLRGALIDLCVDQQDRVCEVDRIAVDGGLVPTFHVTLVLRAEASGLWPKVQRLFKGRRTMVARQRHTLRLDTGFRAIKRKLYSSGELLVEDCS